MLAEAVIIVMLFFFSSRRRHTICSRDWSSDVCSSDLRDFRGIGSGFSFRFVFPVRLCTRWAHGARAHHHGRVGGPVFGSLRAGAFFEGRPEGQEKDGQQKKAAFLSTRWHNMMDFTVRRCGRRERKRKAWI